ncbi:hypothetical protein, partial [Delftia sp. ZNC0008]|uniref:hypothetical protein n=1 Tax=Delftia sp. ZNC0008 TaxID=1339242 RepID=UPI001E2D0DBD
MAQFHICEKYPADILKIFEILDKPLQNPIQSPMRPLAAARQVTSNKKPRQETRHASIRVFPNARG